jgi:hypothetical protein
MAEATNTGGSTEQIRRTDGSLEVPINAVPDAIRNSPTRNQTQLHTLKRGEETVEVTTEKLIEMAQKGWNADEVTQRARESEKAATRALAIQDDLEQVIKSGDVDAFRRMGAAMGIPGNEVETAAASIWGDGSEDEEDEEETPTPRKRQAPQQPQKVDFSQFPPDVQRLLLRAEKARIDEIVGSALDSSEKVRYNMEQYDEKGRKAALTAIRSLVEDKVRGRLNATDGDFGDGSHILKEVLPEVESLLEALGSPRRQTSALGMGLAPGGGDIEVYPKKQPNHVPSSDGNFEQHILEQLAFNQGQVERSKR